MTITIPDAIARQAGINESGAIEELAFTLYSQGRISGSGVRRMCGMDFFEFERRALERGLPVIEYTEDSFRQDMETIRNLEERDRRV